MKVKILLSIVWASLCVCDRQRRSTVLTDESKRVLEHFDFSNFDKQEALNYIDRQRYENQIRGKRSHDKYKTDHGGINERVSDISIRRKEIFKRTNKNENLKSQTFEEDGLSQTLHYVPEFSSCECGCEEESVPGIRSKRGHRSKKKHRSKSHRKEDEGDEGQSKKHRKRKKKRKKKRHYWDEWTRWSPCSVTCGRGRKIRWRKCIVKNCTTGELEMGEKTCQLPACNLLTKLLGL